MIVVDTNILCYLFLTGSRTAQAESAFEKDPTWAAPWLWRSEFRNVLALYIRKEILTLEDCLILSQRAEDLMLGREYAVYSRQVLSLAASSGCSAYDCEFVALAQELGVRLLTTDAKLLDNFPTIATSLQDFLDPLSPPAA